MNGGGFAFFRWRVMTNPSIGDDASWWAFWRRYDFDLWWTAQGKPADEVKP